MQRLNSRHGHVEYILHHTNQSIIVINEFNADDKVVKLLTCHLKFMCNIFEQRRGKCIRCK